MDARQPYLVSISTDTEALRLQLTEIDGIDFLREVRKGLAVVLAPAHQAQRLAGLNGVISVRPDRLERGLPD